MFEAVVLACLYGMPQITRNCEELRDIRGPYTTHDQCLTRVYEIVQELPLYRPHMQPRGYRCEQFTPKTNKKRT